MSSRLLHRLAVMIGVATFVFASGCVTKGTATPGESVESEFAGETMSTGDTDTVPILSHLGLPIDGQILPPTSAMGSPVNELNPGVFSVVAGYPATLRFQCEDTPRGWYNCFEMELLSVVGPGDPDLSDVFETSPDGDWTWGGCSVIPLPPHDPSDQKFTIQTKDTIEPGIYTAKIKVTPYKRTRRAKTLTEIKLIIVQP